MVVDVKE